MRSYNRLIEPQTCYPGSDIFLFSPKRLINIKSLLSRKSWGMPNGIYTIDLVNPDTVR